MKLDRFTVCQLFEIRSPVWGGRKVGLATYKVGAHNEVRITKRNKDGELLYPQPLYISGDKARTYPIEPIGNTGVQVYSVPINDLEVLERE